MASPQQEVRAGKPAAEPDYIEFLALGTRTSGSFRCVSCGWPLIAFGILTRCPTCGDGLWERSPWSPFGVRDRM